MLGRGRERDFGVCEGVCVCVRERESGGGGGEGKEQTNFNKCVD